MSQGQMEHGDRLTVLVVEDDPVAREAIRQLLSRAGYSVQGVGNGEEAERIFAQSPTDVVFLDLHLPGIDGFAVARWLRAASAEKRPLIVAITGQMGPDIQRRSAEVGIDLHLTKPVTAENLLHILDRMRRVLNLPEPAAANPGS